MPICSYLVIPERGATDRVEERLDRISGCDVSRARNRDVLLLVTDTPGLQEEDDLRRRIEALDGIQALLLTFGELDPETSVGDPVKIGRKGERKLPMAEGDAPAPTPTEDDR